MRFKRLFKYILSFILMMSFSVAMAQSAGDKLYNQGLTYQKTHTKASQKKAIEKFQSAKKLYDSQAKKNQCDNAIAVSKSIIASIDGGGSDGSGKKSKGKKESTQTKTPTVKKSFEVSNGQFTIGSGNSELVVNVDATNIEDWDATPIVNEDGSTFLEVTKNADGNSFTIYCGYNQSDTERRQTVRVNGDDIYRYVVVTQAGMPVELETSVGMLEFGKKGGSKDMQIYSTSSREYPANNGRNWYVESKPDWVEVTYGTKGKKDNFFNKIKQKTMDLFGAGEDTPSQFNENNVSPVIVTVDKLTKESSDYNTGRKGEIIICSGTERINILIVQK